MKMNGRGFEVFCETGDQVSAGQKLLTFDREAVKKEGYSDMVMHIVTNADEYPDMKLLQHDK